MMFANVVCDCTVDLFAAEDDDAAFAASRQTMIGKRPSDAAYVSSFSPYSDTSSGVSARYFWLRPFSLLSGGREPEAPFSGV